MKYAHSITYKYLFRMSAFTEKKMFKQTRGHRTGAKHFSPNRWQAILFLCCAITGAMYGQSQDTILSPIALKSLSLEDLMNIEVTSVSKHPEKLLDAASAIQVITNDDIRRSGASNIPQALQLADNLDIAQGTSASWNIGARGFNASVGNKLLVLIDGRSVYTPLFSGVIWNMQDVALFDLDRIEVISGPGGTLWGANAVNGVINITSKNAKETQGWYMEGGAGTVLNNFEALRYGGSLSSNTYFRVYGKYFDQNPAVFDNGTGASDSWYRGEGGFRLDAAASTASRFTLQGDIYTGKTNTTDSTQGDAGGGNVIGRWTYSVSDVNELTLQTYYDRTHLIAPFPGSLNVPGGSLGDNLDTYDIDFQDRVHIGEMNQIVWGVESRFTHDVVSDAPVVAFIPNVLNQKLFSVFAQDEIKPTEKLSITLGSKLEHNDYTGYEFEPNARMQYTLADRQMVWAAVSRAVRSPSRYDRDLYQPDPAYSFPYHLIGNTTFISETVITYELGYRAAFGQNVSGSVSTFYNNYDHLRSLDYEIIPPATLNVFFQNALQARTRGVEFSGDYQATDDWRLHCGIDLFAEEVHVIPNNIDLNKGLNETADPTKQLFLRSSLNLPRDIETDLSLRGVGDIQVNQGSTPATVPGYFELDGRVGWHAMPKLELSVTGQNLLHNHHVEYGYPGSTREEIQRSVFGKIAWEM
ncbi:MAG TPA: TonB-dependent receptor [Bacteroidota bacterium]|nr:TonB-dependent receptor [Bacteroidota bacterium]